MAGHAKLTSMKVYLIFSAVLFGVFALLQINDADAVLIWVCLYGAAAWLGAANAVRPQNPQVVFLLFLMFLVGSVQLFPSDTAGWLHQEEQSRSLEMKLPFIEEARESMGLALAALHSGGIWLWLRQLKARS